MLCRQGCFPCFSKVSWLYLTLWILPSPSFMLFYFHFSSFSSFSASVCSENIYSHLTYSLQELTDSLYPNLFQQLDSPPRVSPLSTNTSLFRSPTVILHSGYPRMHSSAHSPFSCATETSFSNYPDA